MMTTRTRRERKMTKLTENVTKGRNGWNVRVTWSINGTAIIWSDGNTIEDAREVCEYRAVQQGILNRP